MPSAAHIKIICSSATQWEDLHVRGHEYSSRKKLLDLAFIARDQGVQVEADVCEASTQTDSTKFLYLIKNDKDSKLYTGLSLEALHTVIQCMSQHASGSFTADIRDQILMTLMKLKLNLLYEDIARRFHISDSTVSRIITFWIDTLAKHLSDLIVWLPRETIRATMPEAFRGKYPKTTCILDCAETFLEKALNLDSRGETYSNYYKGHNTCKYLVAIAPCGLIMFISQAYGGRTSDKVITKDSGILNYLFEGDEVMADRGFTISDLLYEQRVRLNMPAFSFGNQLSEEDVNTTRKIASVRVHVERAIRRMKVFKILSHRIPISLAPQIDKILVICAALVNLQPDLIKDT